MEKKFILVVLLVIISETSTTWSSSINSLFSARNAQFGEIGGNKNLMESVGNGAQMALDHCQSKFKWERWNCPESAFSSRINHAVTREQSFVSAIKSAGIIYSITRNCSRGELSGCRCDSSRSGDEEYNSIFLNNENKVTNNVNNTLTNESLSQDVHWTWGGCSDSLEYGEQVSKMILEERDKGKDWKALAERHNLAAGRMMVRSTMQRRCRCHGVSGSCTMQTCWMQMAPFHEITNELKIKYNKAKKIDHGQKFNSIGDFDKITDVAQEDLLFLNDSPNYCKADISTGWNGTKGRTCSRNKAELTPISERKSCKTLCRSCGHRVRRERHRLTRRCNCTFIWCCEVQCDTCTETIDQFFCE